MGGGGAQGGEGKRKEGWREIVGEEEVGVRVMTLRYALRLGALAKTVGISGRVKKTGGERKRGMGREGRRYESKDCEICG